VKEWREKLLESVSEFDDAVMEKFFDNPDAITQ
jgi:elongation factor G